MEDREEPVFFILQQLACSENALWNILDGLRANASHVSFFCREFFGSAASDSQLSLETLPCQERLKRQVHLASLLECLALGVTAHIASGTMDGVTITVRSRLRNLLYYLHENCLVLLDLITQKFLAEQQQGRCPPGYEHPFTLHLEIMMRVKRYRRLRKGEHLMALRQHNEMILNVVRQLVRGGSAKRTDRQPATRGSRFKDVLSAVSDLITGRTPLERLRIGYVRSRVYAFMRFRPMLSSEATMDCPWPAQDSYERYGTTRMGAEGPILYFEPLPPMLPSLSINPPLTLLPASSSTTRYTLVLDLDETLVHYWEENGVGRHECRPGLQEFMKRMNAIGYEIVLWTAATQDYADWVINAFDVDQRVHHRLYRQHALPWGPIFVKDLSRLGRDLDRTLIIDNVQENFMLQPGHGIFCYPWYDDPHDQALYTMTPLLEEIVQTGAKIGEILERYASQIPTWAGFSDNEWPPAPQFEENWEGMEGTPPLGGAEYAEMTQNGDWAVARPATSSVSGPYQQPRPEPKATARGQVRR
jgi:hypothetical protein